MIWKGCVVLSLALCVLCDRRSGFSEVKVKKHYKELSHDDHHKSENHEEYANAHPSYEFSYKVDDPHTHDKKEQQETRDGDQVTGHYWLIQPDGHKRLVKYHVDGKRGFSADINYALNKHEVQYNTDKHNDHEEKKEEHPEHFDDKHQEEHHGDEHEEVKEAHVEIEEPVHIEHVEEHVEEHKEHADEPKEHVEEQKEHDEGQRAHNEGHEEHDNENKQSDQEHNEHDEGLKEHNEGHNEEDEVHIELEGNKFGEKIHKPEVKHNDNEKHDDSHKEPEIKHDEEHTPTLKDHQEEHKPTPKDHHDLWSSIRNWGDIHHDKHDDVWSWPKLIHWNIKYDKDEHKHHDTPEVYEENDKKHGNSWSWRKSYDVWEVQHYGNEHKHEGNHKDVKEHKGEHVEPKQKMFIPVFEDHDKNNEENEKKESHVGLREEEHRGQPSYHMPIMDRKPIPYQRRRRLHKNKA